MDKQSPSQMSEQLAQSVPKNLQKSFSKVVQAGMKVMFSEQTHDLMLEQLSQEGDLGEVVGNSIADLMTLLFKQSNETMPPEVIIPAGAYLLFMGADFIEKITGEELTPDILANASETMIDNLMERFGVPKDRFKSTMEKAAQGGYGE